MGEGRFSPEVLLKVTREGTRLFVQENDEPGQEPGAEGGGRFFSKSADDGYSFEFDSAGQVTTRVLHTDGKELPIKRVN